ncbi:hypothetical protein [Jeotgalibacillus marinus]|uniref:Sigma-X negative effector n=1 Tax=Jeotgalibacillus marinus TaxID=86667 RepID=A0ABV3PYS3_9BACL
MMRRSNWEDHEIKELLKKMPKIKSNLSAESMYHQIQQGSKKKAKKRWVPIAASVAAIFLFIIFNPSFQTTDSQLSGGSTDMPTSGSGQLQESREATSTDYSSQESADESAMMLQPIINKGKALYATELGDRAYLTTALITQDDYVVPMTFVLPIEDRGQSMVELYNEWSDSIDEEGLGFMKYHPMSGQLSEERETVSYTINDTGQYTMHSTAEVNLMEVLLHTFSNSNYEELRIVDKEGNVAETGETGQVKPIQLKNAHKAYYMYKNSEEEYYYVPSYESFETMKKAIRSAQTTLPNTRYTSAIPENASLSIEAKDTQLFITLDQPLDGKTEIERQQFIEVFLLTAKSFGYEKVQFTNFSSEPIDGFDLTKPIEVPVGANQGIIR